MSHTYAVPIIVFGTLLTMMFTSVIILFIVVHRNRRRKYRDELQSAEYRSQNEILRIRLEVEERTLNLISFEIHDNINQVLVMARMQLLSAMRQDSKQDADLIIDESCTRLKDVVTQLRDLSHMLNSKAVANMGLVHIIKKELNYLKATTMLDCVFECDEEELPLNPEQELLISRIMQEALSNIIRHAKATAISITITLSEDTLMFAITDNGIGIDRSDLENNQGLGFANLKARLDLLNGRMDIRSQKGEGTAFIFTVPVELG